MLTEAVGLAALAAISPTALLVAAVFLGSANPRRTAVAYLAGAILMTAAMGAIFFAVLRAGHLYQPGQREARYGLRLGFGVLLLLAAALYRRRLKRRGDTSGSATAAPARAARRDGQQRESLISRVIARPATKTGFLAGLIVYTPSLTFAAAVQVVATSNGSTGENVLALAFVVVITVAFVWLPLGLYLLAPDRTGRQLGQFNAWLRRHGPLLLRCALTAAGVILTIDGVVGLIAAP
jgi:hypothetical protein